MSKVSAFLHIEIVHSDPVAAGQFMQDIFGGKIVEDNLAKFVERILPGSAVVHVMVQNVVFQFVKPTDDQASWKEELERNGPGVHNVSFQVKDMVGVEQAMLTRGAKIYSDLLVDLREAGVDCPGPLRALNIDAREQTGLRFELLPEEYGYPPLSRE